MPLAIELYKVFDVTFSNIMEDVFSYHVTYAFQSEFALYSCLNVKKLLARNRRDIWSLSDCNGSRTHNHLVRKRILNHLAKLTKWLSWIVSTYLQCIWLYVLIISRTRFRVNVHSILGSLTFRLLWVRVPLHPDRMLEKHLWRISVFIKVLGYKPASLLKVNSFTGIMFEI